MNQSKKSRRIREKAVDNGIKHWIFHCALFIVIWSLFAVSVSASTIARPMSNSGLVGYWNFEEGTGNSQTFDRSGRGNTGTLTAMDPLTDWVNGATSTGQALDFDGSNDYVDFGSALPVSGTSDRTISYWVKHGSDVAGDVMRFGISPNNMEIRHGADYIPRLIAMGGSQCDSNINVGSGVWKHLVWTGGSNLNTYKLYIDGVLRYSCAENVAVNTSGDAFTIFKAGFGTDLAASLDEVRIYNRILSADEVTRLYNLKKSKLASGIDNTGLVGYWAFEEGTGIRAEDSSFNSNHGTLTLGPTWTQGRVGGALSFDGSDDHVLIGNSSTFNYEYTQPMTVSAWVRRRGDTGSIFSKHSIGISRGYSFTITATNRLTFQVRTNSTDRATKDGNSQLSDDTWYHVTATYSGSGTAAGIKLYVNGVDDGSFGTDDNLGGGTIINAITPQINGQDGTGAALGAMYIDEVRIYDRELSATEIFNLYKGSKASVINKTNKTKISNGLVGYWTFDGKDIYGTTVLDSSGNANVGTLTAGPAPTIGKIGQALKFDGVDDYINLGSPTALDNLSSGPVSYSAWAYFDTLTGAKSVISPSDGASDYVNGIGLATPGNPNRWLFRRKCVTQDLTAETAVGTTVAGAWQHIAATWDGSATADNLHIYYNGVDMPHTASNLDCIGGFTTDNTASISIGRNNANESYTNGRLDDVRVYNRALSADEVYQLYNSGR